MASKIDNIRLEDGSLPAYAWPGGYNLIYYTKDGLTICPDCANKEVDQSQEVVDYEIYWEGDSIVCDDCGKLIESSFGNPNED